MRPIACFLIVAASFAHASAANAQSDIVSQLLKRIVGSKPVAGSTARGESSGIARSTPAQLEGINKRLLATVVTPAIRQDLTAAGPIIETTIVTLACATDATALRTLNSRRLTPRNYGSLDDNLRVTAMGGMQYHDRTTCVDLNRIGAVTKPALNALELTLNFVSASSGEAKVQTISFRRVGDEWLIERLANTEV